MPIVSTTESEALKEIWPHIEEIVLADMFSAKLLVAWHWGISDRNFAVLQKRVRNLSKAGIPANADLPDKYSCVIRGIDLSKLEKAVPTHWEVKRFLVSKLRHDFSSYHAMLQLVETKFDYYQTFKRVNLAIAHHYPDLKEECSRQIEKKEANYVNR